MAPYHRSSAQNSLSSDQTNINNRESNSIDPTQQQPERDIWSSILKQVQQTATNKLPSNKSILVLGDNDSGKSSLIAKMQGIDTTCKGSGLEYHYLMVRDEYRDEQTQCGVWILDGNYNLKSQLLRFALNEENFPDTTLLLVCSMTKPWDIMQSLQYWMTCLQKHINSLNLDPKKFKQYQEQNKRRFQDYISPGDEIEGLTSMRRSQSSSTGPGTDGTTDDQPERDPLPPDVLTQNLGLDIVVAITKTDYMSTLEKDYDYKEEHFDFIQQYIRKFCLQYGATLMYVSAKINKNCDLLYKYLIHRIYGLKFKTPALVVEKDAVFIPSGWDNEKKISILYDNIQSFSPDHNYNDVISPPYNVNPTAKEPETIAEDDQIFLMKLRTQLNQQVPTNANTPLRGLSGHPSGSPIGHSGSSATGPTTPGGGSATKVSGRTSAHQTPSSGMNSPAASAFLDASGKNTPGGEGVLQTFFNSLLNRKSVGGSGGGGGAGSQGSTPVSARAAAGASATAAESLRSRDVHAELDRIIEGTKSSASTKNNTAGE